ncbi:hypothetical protein ACLQ2T_14665 [Micromonospora sp. DT229]
MDGLYCPRTTADAEVVAQALRQQLGRVVGGLAGWLRAAHERGETDDPGTLIGDVGGG